MTTTDKRKRSLYFPDPILREMQLEAKRQERSLSWIVQYAWRLARSELMRLPSVGEQGYLHNAEDMLDDEHPHMEEDKGKAHHHSNRDYGDSSHFIAHDS